MNERRGAARNESALYAGGAGRHLGVKVVQLRAQGGNIHRVLFVLIWALPINSL